MKFFTLPALAAALLFSAVVVIPFLPATRSREGVFVVEVRMASSVRKPRCQSRPSPEAVREVYFLDM